jgi:hypothetical protein
MLLVQGLENTVLSQKGVGSLRFRNGQVVVVDCRGHLIVFGISCREGDFERKSGVFSVLHFSGGSKTCHTSQKHVPNFDVFLFGQFRVSSVPFLGEYSSHPKF